MSKTTIFGLYETDSRLTASRRKIRVDSCATLGPFAKDKKRDERTLYVTRHDPQLITPMGHVTIRRRPQVPQVPQVIRDTVDDMVLPG